MSPAQVLSSGRITAPREAIAGFCRKHHIRRLALFGSVLRDDFRAESDVDVLVEFEPTHVPGFFGLFEMEQEFGGIVGRKVDLNTPGSLSKYFRARVLAEALPLHDEGARLRHMLDASREAVGFAKEKSRADLHADRGLQLILTRLLEIVGEAANKVPQTTRELYPEIPWSAAIALRNRLIHGYEDVDLDIVWQTVNEDLPKLIRALEKAVGG